MLNRSDTVNIFRAAVLAALDTAANETFMRQTKRLRNDSGATDADLPRLFAAIDAQVQTLSERHAVSLVDYDPTSDQGETQ